MARYDSLGIRILRTDRDGAVIFETDGKALKRVR
jgi:beta-lactamase superfamily II metal-dependent hydrolase